MFLAKHTFRLPSGPEVTLRELSITERDAIIDKASQSLKKRRASVSSGMSNIIDMLFAMTERVGSRIKKPKAADKYLSGNNLDGAVNVDVVSNEEKKGALEEEQDEAPKQRFLTREFFTKEIVVRDFLAMLLMSKLVGNKKDGAEADFSLNVPYLTKSGEETTQIFNVNLNEWNPVKVLEGYEDCREYEDVIKEYDVEVTDDVSIRLKTHCGTVGEGFDMFLNQGTPSVLAEILRRSPVFVKVEGEELDEPKVIAEADMKGWPARIGRKIGEAIVEHESSGVDTVISLPAPVDAAEEELQEDEQLKVNLLTLGTLFF